MSIFGFFQSTDEQEETSNAYQAWRDDNPDNPSDDDFYGDCDGDCDCDDDEPDDDEEPPKKWWQL